MPWKECSVMDERLGFVARLLDGESMSEVCREFGISRKTGYKIFTRYKDQGLEALTDRSRRPVRYANQLAPQIERQIVTLKQEKPHWGARKNEQDHVCVLNSVARSIIERRRGKHATAVFTWRGKPLRSVNNTAWVNALKRAVAKYQERLGEPPPEGFRTLHVHDLRHTVGRRLRAAGVALETRQAILGHKSGSITTHYSAAELRELMEAMEFIATDNQRETHALTLLKRKAG